MEHMFLFSFCICYNTIKKGLEFSGLEYIKIDTKTKENHHGILHKQADILENMKEVIQRQMSNKPVPSEYVSKIINTLDGYINPEIITNELYDLLQFAYNEQRGLEPAYKAPTYRR